MSDSPRARLFSAFTFVRDLQERERKRLLAEAVQIKGLMPLLMKRRNGQSWTREDLAEIRAHLRRLSELTPYLAVVALPGAPITLPLLAWWLDRRRQGRKDGRRDAVSSASTGKNAPLQ
jgi:hypothetical protein